MRVHKVERARKARPAHGIAVGDTYYYWTPYRGTTQYSKQYPTRAQRCTNAWADAYALYDAAEAEFEKERGECDTVQKCVALVEALKSALEDLESTLRDTCDEKRDLAEEHFGGSGPHAEMADNMESAADAADAAADELQQVLDALEEQGDDMDTAQDLVDQAASHFADGDPGDYA